MLPEKLLISPFALSVAVPPQSYLSVSVTFPFTSRIALLPLVVPARVSAVISGYRLNSVPVGIPGGGLWFQVHMICVMLLSGFTVLYTTGAQVSRAARPVVQRLERERLVALPSGLVIVF